MACSLRTALVLCTILSVNGVARKVIIDQDCSGPSSTNSNSVLALLLAQDVEVLGITVSSGDQWAPEELLHCYALVKMIGLENVVPVVSGAVFPLVNTREEAEAQFPESGGPWKGAFQFEYSKHPDAASFPEFDGLIPADAPEFSFTSNAAAAFMIEQVQRFPGEVSILALAPMSNLAAAMTLAGDDFTRNVDELWMMAGSVNCSVNPVNGTRVLCDDAARPQHEFNLWFDPEAALRVFDAQWGRGDGLIRVIPADVGFVPLWYDARIASVYTSESPAARYIQTCQMERFTMCDELAAVAWLLSSRPGEFDELLHGERRLVSVNVNHGVGYGDMIVWMPGSDASALARPAPREVVLFTAISEHGLRLFYETFLSLLSSSSDRESVTPMTCSTATSAARGMSPIVVEFV